MIEIITLEHTVDGNNQELFSLIGGFAMSRQVSEQLGNNIYSESGQIWLIANNGNNTLGFTSLLIQKNKKVRMFNLYTTNNADNELKRQLVNGVIDIAKENGCLDVHCIDYNTDANFYQSLGFTSSGKRGKNFTLFVKEIV